MRTLIFLPHLLDKVCSYLTACVPEEGCGLASGMDGRVTRIFPITNELHSPVRFRMAPGEMLDAFNSMEAAGEEMLVIFHSHPQGPEFPSVTDINEFFYPGVAMMIFSPDLENGWQVRGFDILKGQVNPVEIKLA